MDRNSELAEMVVNKEITLEDAIQSTKDVSDLMSKLNFRKSMRNALQTAVMYRRLMELETNIPVLCFAYDQYASLVTEYSKLSLDWIKGKTSVDVDYDLNLFKAESSIHNYLRNSDLRFMDDDVIAVLTPSKALGLDYDQDSPYYKTDVTFEEYSKRLLEPTYEAAAKRINEAIALTVAVPKMMITTLAQAISEMLDVAAAALLS